MAELPDFDPSKFDRSRGKNYTRYAPKMVKARKPYACDDCHGPIEKGDQYEYSTRPIHDSFTGPPIGSVPIRICKKCVEARPPPPPPWKPGHCSKHHDRPGQHYALTVSSEYLSLGDLRNHSRWMCEECLKQWTGPGYGYTATLIPAEPGEQDVCPPCSNEAKAGAPAEDQRVP